MKTCWGMDFHLHAFLTPKLQGDILSDLSSGRNKPLYLKTESSCAPISDLHCLENRKPSCPCRLTDSNSSVVRTNRHLVLPLTEIFGYCPSVNTLTAESLKDSLTTVKTLVLRIIHLRIPHCHFF